MGRQPRTLEALPISVTRTKDFNRKGLPVLLCSVCDGSALTLAKVAHARRSRKSS